ncbi:MAG: phospholipase D-like domain-containing protein [Thermoplasmata archaeon]
MNVTLVVSGERWVGYGLRSFSSVLEEMISDAKWEIVFTAYMISDLKILENLKRALSKGISVEIFIYKPEESGPSIVDWISMMKRDYDNLTVHMIRDYVLHAKVIIVDQSLILLGSANPTLSGMVRNYEIGLFLRDESLAQKILELLRGII